MDVKDTGRDEAAASGASELAALPHQMFYEILPRLPLRTLMRFKCVCKQWLSTILDPKLAYDFLVRHQGDRHGVLISFSIDGLCGPRLLFSLDLDTGLTRPIHNLNEPPITRESVSQSLNGLACIESDGGLTYICNLSTGETASLPPESGSDFPGCLFMDTSSSVGFDQEKGEYKILKTWWSTGIDEQGNDFHKVCHKILTLGTGVWRTVDAIDFHFTDGVFLNGVMHFLTWDWDLHSVKSIVGFDVGKEKFREMSLPDTTGLPQWQCPKLVQFRGHLGLIDFPRHEHEYEDVIVVHELKDYRTQSWEAHRIVLPPSWRQLRGEDCNIFNVMAISSGEILLTPTDVRDRMFVLIYNWSANSLRRLEIIGLPENRLSHPTFIDGSLTEYRESILSLAGLN